MTMINAMKEIQRNVVLAVAWERSWVKSCLMGWCWVEIQMVNSSQMEIWKKYGPCRVAARAKSVKEHICSVCGSSVAGAWGNTWEGGDEVGKGWHGWDYVEGLVASRVWFFILIAVRIQVWTRSSKDIIWFVFLKNKSFLCVKSRLRVRAEAGRLRG